MENSADANVFQMQFAALCAPCTVPQQESLHLTPLRRHAPRSLGAGAFMKDETLRGVDGRVLRHGKFDPLASRRRRTSDATDLTSNAGIAASCAVKESKVFRRRRLQESYQRRCSKLEVSKAHFPESRKTTPPPAENDTRSKNPYLSPSDSDSEDGSSHPAWKRQWYIYYWTRMARDIQEADEMFRLFINADQCEDTMCTM